MWWWHSGTGWFFPGILMMLFWILVFVVIVSMIWRRHRWGHYHDHGRYWQGEKAPEDVLADRFARGEIDEEEYNKRLEVLRRRIK
jgi:putative membrane protein